ncbi:MAG TPA: phospholipase D-like domain-containing protein [Solimonas sp.]|nr:phospholipase D-like domain-containing protein [Solimonas sp.]
MEWPRNTVAATLQAPALCCAIVLSAGCATLPDAQQIAQAAEAAPAPAGKPRPAPVEAELRAAVGDGDIAFIREVTRIESVVARRPLLGGNRVTLLKDGPATHRAQLAAIAAAKQQIHLDVYLLTDDELGQRYEKVLAERARAGVEVRLITDGFGGIGAGPEFRERLSKAGVQIREFNSVNPLKDPRLWRITRRNHRKILVVDGRVAFTGGINITDNYSAAPTGSGSRLSGSGSGSSSRSRRDWRDTQIRVEGPATAEFQREFLRYWNRLGAEVAEPSTQEPPLPRRGDQFVRVVVDQGQDLLGNLLSPADVALQALSVKERQESRIYASYLTAIAQARQRVWITQAYFAPNEAFIAVLEAAARRGVDVRLMMPGETDVSLLKQASRSHYQRLLDAGIRLYEYQDSMLHAKTAVIDGVWSTVGSSNLDYRSFILNDEANAIVIGRDFGRQMERMFEEDLAQAREITAAQWRQRPWLQRIRERGAAAFKWLL